EMGKQYGALEPEHVAFIERQKLFFVGTATDESRINISPKGMDSLRIVGKNRVMWLNVTGSGNETAAHVQIDPRMTVMFCAFEGNPLILRLYGKACVIHRNDEEWEECYSLFNPLPGARQIFDLSVEMVQTSCGMGVPFFAYERERDQLNEWAGKKGEEGIGRYWEERNRFSIDGLPTGIVEKNLEP
ncbi:MAG TPA: pyridoxamine 5'-phosphate oxidase family protein, partial [Burkholderiales bacterium]|nr:pyridoxamine 5'-phosphate oxidase family protein [Burkholderiales bacterium]